MAREQGLTDINYGAWKTAKQLFRDRGITGLYCGYRLHLGKLAQTHFEIRNLC